MLQFSQLTEANFALLLAERGIIVADMNAEIEYGDGLTAGIF